MKRIGYAVMASAVLATVLAGCASTGDCDDCCEPVSFPSVERWWK